MAGCTGSQQKPDLDKDDDLALDAEETKGITITIDLVTGPDERFVTSDPTNPDTDGDGLLDGDELFVRGSDPRDIDTDDDGLVDGEDIPTERAPAQEWRQLGILELEGLFLGELDACVEGEQVLRSRTFSSDLPVADELGDGEELHGWDIVVRNATRHVTSDPCKPDTDADGLLDHDEKALLADPRAPDTDHDGVRDGVDADPLHDLSLQFHDATIEGSNATSATIVFVFGDKTAEIRWPGNGTAIVEVSDQTADREHLAANGIVRADAADGTALGGAILNIDVVQGTIAGAQVEGDRLVVAGANATISLRWSVVRR